MKTYNIGGEFAATLTTTHSAVSYGVPVLVAGDTVYGAGDRLPNGAIAGRYIQAAAHDCGHDTTLADKFAASAPAAVPTYHLDANGIWDLLGLGK